MCRDICLKYRFKKNSGGEYYSIGASRCQGRCGGIFIKWEGLWCPCCGYRLRKNPRNKKGKTIRTNIEKSRIVTNT